MHASIVNLKNKRMETYISFFMIMWKFLPINKCPILLKHEIFLLIHFVLLKHEIFLFFVRNELINKKKIDKSF